MSHISAEIWHERHNIPAFIDPAHQRSSGKVVPQVIWSGIISSGEKSALPPCFGKMPLCPARWNLSTVRILKKPFTLARKTVINSTQISHIIRHNNMAIFAPLTLSDKISPVFRSISSVLRLNGSPGRIPQHSSNLNTTGRISSG